MSIDARVKAAEKFGRKQGRLEGIYIGLGITTEALREWKGRGLSDVMLEITASFREEIERLRNT